jgi:Pex14 N-terminal domain
MAEDSQVPPPSNTVSEQPKPGDSLSPVPTPPAVQDRTELFDRARTFLNSPQILDQDAIAKRKFLSEKGLTESEIEHLLREPVRGSWFPLQDITHWNG